MKTNKSVHELFQVLRDLDPFSTIWLKPRLFPKGKILMEVGDTCHHLYLIEKGVMRAYQLREHTDITTWMVADGNIACVTDSFLLGIPSSVGLETLETLENTWAYSISFEQYRVIRDYNNLTASLVISLLEDYLIHTQQRIELFRYHSVDERIGHYLKQPTSLFCRVPDRYIATYLGTTESTFSKCLKRVLDEMK
ncbi:MAG TPA: Crp/Fnr family transcriptional regulator [Dyadobacter sp.]|jgi:CRP-like cAMP-binding protein|nr:Crp/Fnr family transcriptional regulator [Dyadobacter sp.]